MPPSGLRPPSPRGGEGHYCSVPRHLAIGCHPHGEWTFVGSRTPNGTAFVRASKEQARSVHRPQNLCYRLPRPALPFSSGRHRLDHDSLFTVSSSGSYRSNQYFRRPIVVCCDIPWPVFIAALHGRWSGVGGGVDLRAGGKDHGMPLVAFHRPPMKTCSGQTPRRRMFVLYS